MHNNVLPINEMLGNILCPVLLWMELTCNSHEKSVKSGLFQHGAFFNKVIITEKGYSVKGKFQLSKSLQTE